MASLQKDITVIFDCNEFPLRDDQSIFVSAKGDTILHYTKAITAFRKYPKSNKFVHRAPTCDGWKKTQRRNTSPFSRVFLFARRKLFNFAFRKLLPPLLAAVPRQLVCVNPSDGYYDERL